MVEGEMTGSLNPGHRSLESISKIATIREEVFGGYTPDERSKIAQAFTNLPGLWPRTLKDAAHYRAEIITPISPKEAEVNGKKTGLLFYPGVPGTASGTAHIAAELFAKAKEQMGNVDLAASFSSSTSIDTQRDPFPSSAAERAIQQAVFTARVLVEHPVDEVYLVGHSAGGMELPYLVPILKKLLEEKNIPTKIAGVILAQAGGQFEQSSAGFALKTGEVTNGKLEAAGLFPSIADLHKVMDERDKTLDQGDKAGEFFANGKLEALRERYKHPEQYNLLSTEQLQQLHDFNKQTEDAWMKNGDNAAYDRIVKKREAFLHGIIMPIFQGADIRSDKPSIKGNLRIARSTLLRRSGRITQPVPDEIRAELDVPVAVLNGTEDRWFPVKAAEFARTEQHMEGREAFPNTPVVYEGKIDRWSHTAPAIDPKRFAEVIIDVARRMQQEQKQPDTQPRNRKLTYIEHPKIDF